MDRRDLATVAQGMRLRAQDKILQTAPGMLVFQEVKRRRILAEMLSSAPDADHWSIVTGWQTSLVAEPDDRCPADTLARDLPVDGVRLFQGGREVTDPATPYDHLATLGPERGLMAVPPPEWVDPDSPFKHVEAIPTDDESRAGFRLSRRFWSTNWAASVRDPRTLRPYELVRLEDPVFFRSVVERYVESALGWGTGAVRDHSPTLNSYLGLYYTSVLRRALGPAAGLRLIEIGGGYGNLGRVLRRTSPKLVSTHVVVDLAPMLDLQRWFLTREFPDASEAKEPDFDGDFGFVDPSSISTLEGFGQDLVVATHSLTELDAAVASEYLEVLVRPARAVLVVGQRTWGRRRTDWMFRSVLAMGFEIQRFDVLGGVGNVAMMAVRP